MNFALEVIPPSQFSSCRMCLGKLCPPFSAIGDDTVLPSPSKSDGIVWVSVEALIYLLLLSRVTRSSKTASRNSEGMMQRFRG